MFNCTHAMGANVAGVIGSAVAAGVLLALLYAWSMPRRIIWEHLLSSAWPS